VNRGAERQRGRQILRACGGRQQQQDQQAVCCCPYAAQD
jgi:hypothetical protein